MKRHVGMRRVLKWGGTSVGVLLAVATATRREWGLKQWQTKRAHLRFSAYNGDLMIRWWSDERLQPGTISATGPFVLIDYHWVDSVPLKADGSPDLTDHLAWGRLRDSATHEDGQTLVAAPHTWPIAQWGQWGVRAVMPSWLLLPPAVLVTAALWWRDRRPRYPPGHCQTCGYDLTGNVSGRCPECGTVIPPKA